MSHSLINTLLQRGELPQPLVPTASAVSDTRNGAPEPCETAQPANAVEDSQSPLTNHTSPEPPSLAPNSVSAPSCLCVETEPKKHKPYWFNGHYYENPEYPEHVVRAMFPRAAS